MMSIPWAAGGTVFDLSVHLCISDMRSCGLRHSPTAMPLNSSCLPGLLGGVTQFQPKLETLQISQGKFFFTMDSVKTMKFRKSL